MVTKTKRYFLDGYVIERKTVTAEKVDIKLPFKFNYRNNDIIKKKINEIEQGYPSPEVTSVIETNSNLLFGIGDIIYDIDNNKIGAVTNVDIHDLTPMISKFTGRVSPNVEKVIITL